MLGNDKSAYKMIRAGPRFALCDAAFAVFKTRGHSQVLVYTPVGDDRLNARYESLGFNRGGDFTCYWKYI